MPQPTAPNVGQGPKPDGVNVTERVVSHLRQAVVPGVTIKAKHVQTSWWYDWADHLKEQYWLKAGEALQLSSHYLDMLEKNQVITSPLRQQAEQAACDKDRNFMVLNHIARKGKTDTCVGFLNLSLIHI